MFDIISKVLLITLLILQIAVMIYLLISNIRRDREDKKFWNSMQESLQEATQKYYEDCNKCVEQLEEENKNEQDQ